jgi:hypothetical protein
LLGRYMFVELDYQDQSFLQITTMPRRRPNAELRSREHLTDAEIERLMATAWNNRLGATATRP